MLHDAGTTTRDRVLWTQTLNIFSHADDAWFEMFAVARDQAAIKQQAGQDARGRKNTKPVLHYTLAWAVSDNPSEGHMRDTALSSLKALGLDGHQVVMAAHGDKEHLHVHIVVNTIHPETGLTASLKYTKEKLSRWAEAYERQHGIHCEERIKNNEKRRDMAGLRDSEKVGAALAGALGQDVPARVPYVPIKYTAVGRQQWMERKAELESIRTLNAAMVAQHRAERDATWERQKQEAEWLTRNSQAAADNARNHVNRAYKGRWRDLYRGQKREQKHIARVLTHPLERAVFVYSQRERLGRGKPLSLRQMVSLICSGARLEKRVAQVHDAERRALARQQKGEARALTDTIWARHKQRFAEMKQRQTAERKAERDAQSALTRPGFVYAKQIVRDLARFETGNGTLRRAPDRIEPARSFEAAAAENAAPAPRRASDYVERIRRDMEAWRRRNRGRDFGREM